jgi:BetI-type transcriptional repressor, C-terminal
LRELRDEPHTALRGLCRGAVDALGAPSPEAEAERLHALIDGLALHAILAPGGTPPAPQRELLAAHLGALATR